MLTQLADQASPADNRHHRPAGLTSDHVLAQFTNQTPPANNPNHRAADSSDHLLAQPTNQTPPQHHRPAGLTSDHVLVQFTSQTLPTDHTPCGAAGSCDQALAQLADQTPPSDNPHHQAAGSSDHLLAQSTNQTPPTDPPHHRTTGYSEQVLVHLANQVPAADNPHLRTTSPSEQVFVQLADHADRAWRAGDTTAAIEVADQVLASGVDPYCRAAGVAAAASAADGALFDAVARWREVAASTEGAASAFASGRAALAGALVGELDAAERDLEAARQLGGHAPRGLTVLLDGVAAALGAVRGDFPAAARKLAGLAVASVPADPLAAERWDNLAMVVLGAGEDDATARALFTAPSPRRLLIAAWLDLRAGRLADARAGVLAASAAPVMRRDAVLAAAVSVGLARRAGDREALRATWHRVAPVVVGADVEILLLDAWGELAVAAEHVDREMIVAGMTAAVARAGNPAWAMATLAWWALQRATTADEAHAAAAALPDTPRGRAGRVWASVRAGDVDPAAVRDAAAALADRPWEAAALCGEAAARATDPASVKHLLGRGRALRATVTAEDKTDDDKTVGVLSKRERAVGELLVDGLTQKEIGAKLYISPKTVEQHVARIRQKLPATNRAELIAALRKALS
jgi:DNA-binding CsgD family transcriptional regulator